MKKYCGVIMVLLLVIVAAFGLTAGQDAASGGIDEASKIRIITRLTGNMLSRCHYRTRKMNEEVSQYIFDQYIKILDPQRCYFTASDIAAFYPVRKKLAERIMRGETAAAFEIYSLFRLRFSEYHKFAENELKKGFDFTGNDEFIPDRRKMPRAESRAELEKLWRSKLKNDVLYYKLLSRTMLNEFGEKESPAAKMWAAQTPEAKVLKRLRDMQNSIDQRDGMDILGIYLTSAAMVFGPHSGYYPPKQNEDFEISMRLSLTGIGATLTSDDGFIKVVDVVPGGPADKSGAIHVEDRIIAVTQENAAPVDLLDMPVDHAVKYIRGAEGSKVTLTILPGLKGRNAAPENVTLVREKIALKDSEAQGEIVETDRPGGGKMKVGIIELPGFYMDFAAAARGDSDYKSCTRDIKKILRDFNRQKVEAVVLDMRLNGGGSLVEAISLAGLFFSTGPVVQIQDSDRNISCKEDDDPSISWTGPLVVLTSKMSASATEIVSGALKDCRRAVVVGDSRTFGKGTVLDVMELQRMLKLVQRDFPAGTLRYETAMFYRINGDSVQQSGIRPDIVLPSLTEGMEIGEVYGDFPLPFDRIKPTGYSFYYSDLDNLVPALRQASEKRVNASEKFAKLRKNIDYLARQRKCNRVSLNEEKRWKEYCEQKQLAGTDDEEREKMVNSSRERKKRRRKEDIHLQEAVNIACDIAAAEQSGKLHCVTAK